MRAYRVPRIARPPTLDGGWDSEGWSTLPPLGPFLRHDGEPARQETWARLGHDGHRLYIAFRCADTDVWGTLRERDSAIYNEEVVEVFLDVEGVGARYFEIEVSPHNVVLDGINTWSGGELQWDPSWDCNGLRTAVRVDGVIDDPHHEDTGWSVTMAIPFASLGVTAPTSWRANLYRIDVDRRRQLAEYQAWSPTQEPGEAPFFNVPARFGRLDFE